MPQAELRQRRFALGASQSQLPWEFFWASDATDQDVSYDEAQCVRRFGRPLRPGEIGCFTSHFKIWKWLANSEYDQVVILEDDVLVDWSIIQILSETSLSDWGVDMLRLFSTHPIKFKVARYKFLSDHCHLLRLRGLCLGTQAYLITREGARALISVFRTIDAPVDWVLSRYWEISKPAYCLFPFPAIELLTQSTIGHTPAQYDISTVDKGIHLALRLRDRFARLAADSKSIDRSRFGVLSDRNAGAAIKQQD